MLRMEKDFLWGNSWALIVSLVLMLLFMVVWKNLPLTILSMSIALAARLWLLEYRLIGRLGVSVRPILLTETFVCVAYVILSIGISGWQGALIYAVVVLTAAAVSWQIYLKNVLKDIRRLKLVI